MKRLKILQYKISFFFQIKIFLSLIYIFLIFNLSVLIPMNSLLLKNFFNLSAQFCDSLKKNNNLLSFGTLNKEDSSSEEHIFVLIEQSSKFK